MQTQRHNLSQDVLPMDAMQSIPKSKFKLSRLGRKSKKPGRDLPANGGFQRTEPRPTHHPVERGNPISYSLRRSEGGGYFDCHSFQIGSWFSGDSGLSKPLIWYSLGEKPYIDYRFIVDGQRLVIHIPFLYMKDLLITHEADGTSMLIELHRPPEFFMCDKNSVKLNVCDDFTPDQQASREPLHLLRGDWSHWDEPLKERVRAFQTSFRPPMEEVTCIQPDSSTLPRHSRSPTETVCSGSTVRLHEPSSNYVNTLPVNEYVDENVAQCLETFEQVTVGCDEPAIAGAFQPLVASSSLSSMDCSPNGQFVDHAMTGAYASPALGDNWSASPGQVALPPEYSEYDPSETQSFRNVLLDNASWTSGHRLHTGSIMSSESIFSHPSTIEEPSEALQVLVNMLVERIMIRFEEYRALGFTTHGASPDDSSRSDSQAKSLRTMNSSLTSGSSKRLKSEDSDDDESGFGDRGGAPSGAKRQARGAKPGRFYACPYTKYDPERYGERNHDERYRTCGTIALTTIARVKQHLERTHKRPDFYCGRCYQDLKDRDTLDTHLQLDERCEKGAVKYQEKMGDKQWKFIKGTRLDNSSKSWFIIFGALFPDVEPPASPYASQSNPAQLSLLTDFFRFVGPQELFGLIRQRLDSLNEPPPADSTMRTLIVEAFETTLPMMAENIRQDLEPRDAMEQSPLYQPRSSMDSGAFSGMTHDAVLTTPYDSTTGFEAPTGYEPTTGYYLPSTNAGDFSMNYGASKMIGDLDAMFQTVVMSQDVGLDSIDERLP